jgi:hypothetical protein
LGFDFWPWRAAAGRTLDGTADGPLLLVLDCPELFDRPGGPYGNQAGQDWADNGLRFAVFSRAAADVAGGAVEGWNTTSSTPMTGRRVWPRPISNSRPMVAVMCPA